MANAITMTGEMEVSARKRPRRPQVRFLAPAELEPYKDALWEMNARMFDRSRADMESDLEAAELHAVFLSEGQVVGICTVMEREFEVGGRRIFTIGLGRAMVREDYRNQFLVQRALIFRWMRRFSRRPLQPIYIWGSCVSYKSYLSFVRVLRVVYPVAGVPTPERDAQVIDVIGKHWYGDAYDAGRKLVRVPDFRVFDETTRPREEDLRHTDIRYYCEQVPVGDDATYGLLTISPCIRSNFLPMVGSWIRNRIRKALGLRKKR